jgi:hypothetical protein
MAHSSLRFGIGRFTTEAEIDFVIKHIVGTVKKLRDMRYVVRYPTCILLLISRSQVRCGKWFKKALILIPLTGHSTSTTYYFVS